MHLWVTRFRRRATVCGLLIAAGAALSACGGESFSSTSSATGTTSSIGTTSATGAITAPATTAASPGSTASTSASSATAPTAAVSPTPAPAVLAFSAVDYPVAQSTKAVTVTVTRAGSAGSPTSVQYATADGSGVAGSVYTPSHGTLQWAANDTNPKTISVPVNGAAPFAGRKSFEVALSNPSADAALSAPSSATVTVSGDASAGDLAFSAAGYSVAQNGGTLTVSVGRSAGSSGAVSVAYATANGTAAAGKNYSAASGTLNWANNDSTGKTFSVAINGAQSLAASVSFTVTLSAPGGGAVLGSTATATVNITPPSTPPTGNAGKVLSYLGGLDTGNGKRVLSGQHASIWNSDLSSLTQPLDVVNPLLAATGQSPAILALVLNYATDSYAYTVDVTDSLANQWWSAGGLVMLSLYDNDPTFSFNSSGAPIGQKIPSSAFHAITDKTSAAYAQWHSQLDTYAAALHKLTDSGNVVLFRPFIEINGDWNWYGGENPTDFIAVWQDMHDYLMKTKGLTNVLWIYNVNAEVGQYMAYYPGAPYVDIVGMDIYDYGGNIVADANVGGMYSALVATGKPLIFPEVGLAPPPNAPANFTLDNTALIKDIEASLPNVVGFVMFNGGWAISNQNNASGLLNSSWVANRSDVPSGL